MINSMKRNLPFSAKDRTIVIDAGIATAENIKWLKENNYYYIAVNRGKASIDLDYIQMEVNKIDETKGIKIEIKQFVYEQEVYVLCKNKKKVAKETSMRKRLEDLFLERLGYYKAGLSIPRRTKKYNKVIELIGRLKEKYPSVVKLYTVEVIPEKDKPATNPDLLTKKNHMEEEKLIRKRNWTGRKLPSQNRPI